MDRNELLGCCARQMGARGAEQALMQCALHGIAIVAAGEPGYPDALRRLPHPPPLLCIQGNARLLHTKNRLTMVGTRHPTSWARQAAEGAAASAAAAGWIIVSGLAQGCDTHAHLGALKAGGCTVSVEATPLTQVYPAANRPLVTRMYNSSGCRISALLPGQPPQRHQFVLRDAFQAALGDALLLVESDVAGGSMHAVRMARKLQIPVACLVPLRQYSSGTKHLLQEGATPIADAGALQKWLSGIHAA